MLVGIHSVPPLVVKESRRMAQQEPRVAGDYETVLFEVKDNVASVTLNRPEAMNAFNRTMLNEFRQIWGQVRVDDDIHVVVLRAAGERAFSTGLDVKEGLDVPDNPWSAQDPGEDLSPKQNKVWKPVIAAVHGMVAGGAFYWLNDCDIIISADDATFFDPHVSYGLTSALEPIGLARRIPLGEALRWALVGLDERMSAERAREIGLVSELVPHAQLWGRAEEVARIIAAKPPAAIQGTVRAIWETHGLDRETAQSIGWHYTRIGNPIGKAQVSRETFVKPKWTLR
jgi:enoyl-CoA hydratase/carnithine racemase